LDAFYKVGKTYVTNGTQSDVSAAIANASRGDTISIPAGTFTWGARSSAVYINKVITLAGAGSKNTTINLSSSGPTYGDGVIAIKAACTVRDFSIHGANGPITAISADTTSGWRITNITYYGGLAEAYFCYVGGVYGVIENCHIFGEIGSAELIFGRGPADSWQSPSSLGGADNVFIEDCTFGGRGYVCDANANARFVVRFCTINAPMKIDGHGLASNTPPRGVRHMEIYGNTWTTDVLYYSAIELRGGTGYVFDNSVPNIQAESAADARFFLVEYGYNAPWPNFGNVYQTLLNYPIADQIGVGMDPKVAASEPMYLWNNTVAKGTADWTLQWGGDPLVGALALYRQQVGNLSASFTRQDIVAADRDYYKQTVGVPFIGSSGVGRGTRAQMDAIKPIKSGVGFWVTDEGEWNASHIGPDGCLYKWNGSMWILSYEPYSYPHPLRR
jgi:hypothetical protein